jgi:hypothetical protein
MAVKFIIVLCSLLVLFYVVLALIKRNLFVYLTGNNGVKYRKCRKCGSVQKEVMIYKGSKGIWLATELNPNHKDESCICNVFL